MSVAEVDAHMTRRIADSAKGGPDQRMVASRGRDVLATHRPVGEGTKRTCSNCGHPWPCGGYAYVLAPD